MSDTAELKDKALGLIVTGGEAFRVWEIKGFASNEVEKRINR